MMGTKDIETVMIGAVERSGLVPLERIYLPNDFPPGKVTAERAVIFVKQNRRGPIFNEGFVEINFCVPDEGGRAAHARLQQLESEAVEHFWDDVVGDYGTTTFRYGLYSHEIGEDKELGCHYANIRLLFETLNVR